MADLRSQYRYGRTIVRLRKYSSTPTGALEYGRDVLTESINTNLVPEVELLLIAVEFQLWQADIAKYFLYNFDISRRTKALSATTLKIARATKLAYQSIHELLILGG